MYICTVSSFISPRKAEYYYNVVRRAKNRVYTLCVGVWVGETDYTEAAERFAASCVYYNIYTYDDDNNNNNIVLAHIIENRRPARK